MGDNQNGPFQLSLNASLKVDFQGSRVTFDGGLILVRELDERLGFGDLIAQHLTDSRCGKNTQLPRSDLLRQSVYSRMAENPHGLLPFQAARSMFPVSRESKWKYPST